MGGPTYTTTFDGKRHWNVAHDGHDKTGIIRGATYIGVSHEEADMPEERRYYGRPVFETAVWLRVERDEESVSGVAMTPAAARQLAAALLHMAAWVETRLGESTDS
jgi:hypothetical protein